MDPVELTSVQRQVEQSAESRVPVPDAIEPSGAPAVATRAAVEAGEEAAEGLYDQQTTDVVDAEPEDTTVATSGGSTSLPGLA